MQISMRQSKDRNGDLYEITLRAQIVGDADDLPTAEWLKNTIAAAFEKHGEMTHDARKAVDRALHEAQRAEVCSLFWP